MITYTFGVWNPPDDIWQLIVQYVGLVQEIRNNLNDAENMVDFLNVQCLNKCAFKAIKLMVCGNPSIGPHIRKYYNNFYINCPAENRKIIFSNMECFYHIHKIRNITRYLEAQRLHFGENMLLELNEQ